MIHRLLLIGIVAVSCFTGTGQLARSQPQLPPCCYPDLQTAPPSDLFFDQRNDGTYLLRFSNTVMNMGPGRLEIQGNPKPPKKKDRDPTVRQIYQNVYDAPVGGTQVIHKQVQSDTIYHAGHQHFHFADFARYDLLVQDSTGYAPTEKKGTKTSFCIMDTTQVPTDPSTTYPAQYWTCGGELQGLTPGWGDTYDYTLADQWVVLGTQPLADGEYGLRSTADPLDRLDEGGPAVDPALETNNTAVTYFTVSGGQMTNVRAAP